MCRGIFQRLDALTDRAVKIAMESNVEFNSFLVGITGDREIEEMQESIASTLGISTMESFRNNLSRELGKILTDRFSKPVRPQADVVFLFDIRSETASLRINPLYIEGRYRKYTRDIQQTSVCPRCRGRGCDECNQTGLARSVEREIVEPLYSITGAPKVVMHAAGREDKNVRMLGTGRPFVVEIKSPKRRNFDYEEWKSAVNSRGMVEIMELAPSSRHRVIEMKRAGETAQKEYVGTVEFERELSSGDLVALINTFTNAVISQYTPIRVLRERGNALRKKKVHWLKIEQISPNQARFHIRTDGGLYIKELVSGDNGRTSPSFAEVLGTNAKCVELDVVAVYEIGAKSGAEGANAGESSRGENDETSIN